MMVLSRRPSICLASALLAASICLALPLSAQDQKKDPAAAKDDKKADVKKDDVKKDDKKPVDKKDDKKPVDKKVDKKKDDKKVDPKDVKKEEPAKPDLTKEKRDPAIQELKGHNSWIYSLAISPDGKQLLSASRDRTLKIWDLASGKELQTFKDNPDNTKAAVFLPQARVAGSTGKWNKDKKVWEGEIRIWDQTGKLVKSLKGHSQEIECLAVSHNGKLLASGSEDHSIIVWDLASGKDILTIKAHAGRVHGLAFSADDKRLASAGEDKTVRIWDLVPGKTPVKIETKKDEPKVEEPKKDEPKDKKVDVKEKKVDVKEKKVDAKDKKDKKDKKVIEAKKEPAEKLDAAAVELKGPGRDFTCVAFSPDGKLLAAGNLEGLVKVWDLSDNKEVAELKTTEGVLSLAFSPDGSKIAAGTWDWAIRVYEARTGKQLKLIHAHAGTVTALVFAADGRLISGGLDNVIKIWDLSKIQRTGNEKQPEKQPDPPPAK